MGWDPVYVKQLKCVGNFWCKLSNMDQNRVNFKISKYCYNLASRNCSNWHFRAKNLFIKFGCVDFSDCTLPLNKNLVVDIIVKNAMDVLIDEWTRSVHCIFSKSVDGRNKLRLYQKFKFDFEQEHFVNKIMSYRHRSALAKFRCGVAPIRLEIGRYERLMNDRVCPICNNGIEDEMHVLLHCPQVH